MNLEELDQRKLAQDDPRGFLDRFSNGAVIDEAQMFFWRDHVGHEVNMLRDSGTCLDVWQCKSGMTYNTEWAKDLDYWSRLAGSRVGRLSLVYGGRESFTHRGIHVAGWANIPSTASTRIA